MPLVRRRGERRFRSRRGKSSRRAGGRSGRGVEVGRGQASRGMVQTRTNLRLEMRARGGARQRGAAVRGQINRACRMIGSRSSGRSVRGNARMHASLSSSARARRRRVAVPMRSRRRLKLSSGNFASASLARAPPSARTVVATNGEDHIFRSAGAASLQSTAQEPGRRTTSPCGDMADSTTKSPSLGASAESMPWVGGLGAASPVLSHFTCQLETRRPPVSARSRARRVQEGGCQAAGVMRRVPRGVGLAWASGAQEECSWCLRASLEWET